VSGAGVIVLTGNAPVNFADFEGAVLMALTAERTFEPVTSVMCWQC
jgi:hypothetical protein